MALDFQCALQVLELVLAPWQRRRVGEQTILAQVFDDLLRSRKGIADAVDVKQLPERLPRTLPAGRPAFRRITDRSRWSDRPR